MLTAQVQGLGLALRVEGFAFMFRVEGGRTAHGSSSGSRFSAQGEKFKIAGWRVVEN